MKRTMKAAITFAVVGGLAALSIADRGAGAMAFFVIFFGGIAAIVVALSGGTASAGEFHTFEMEATDPFLDQDGVRHTHPQPVQPVKPLASGPIELHG